MATFIKLKHVCSSCCCLQAVRYAATSLQMMAATHIHVKIHQENMSITTAYGAPAYTSQIQVAGRAAKSVSNIKRNYFVCISQHQHAWVHQQVPFLMKATAAVC